MFNLPPSHHAPPPPQPLGFCLRWELERAIRSVSFAQFLSCCAHTAVRPSFSLLSSAGVYSRCHLIAGRFSRVRYRSATESTESAAAATVARFSTSRAPNRLFLRHLLLLSSFFLFLSRGARALLFLSVSRGHVSCCSLPILGSLPPRDVERARWWFCKREVTKRRKRKKRGGKGKKEKRGKAWKSKAWEEKKEGERTSRKEKGKRQVTDRGKSIEKKRKVK